MAGKDLTFEESFDAESGFDNYVNDPEVQELIAANGLTNDTGKVVQKAAAQGLVAGVVKDSLDNNVKSNRVENEFGDGVELNKNLQPVDSETTFSKGYELFQNKLGESESDFRARLDAFKSGNKALAGSIRDRISQIENKRTKIDFTPLLALVKDKDRANLAAKLLDGNKFTREDKENQLFDLKSKLGQLEDNNEKFALEFEQKNRDTLNSQNLSFLAKRLGADMQLQGQRFDQLLQKDKLSAQEKSELVKYKHDLQLQANALGIKKDLAFSKMQMEVANRQVDLASKQVVKHDADNLVKTAEGTLSQARYMIDQIRDPRNWTRTPDGKWRLSDTITKNIQFQRARLLNGAGVLTNQDFIQAGGSQDISSRYDREWQKLAGGQTLSNSDLKNFVGAARTTADIAIRILKNKRDEYANDLSGLGVDKKFSDDYFGRKFRDKTDGASESINTPIAIFEDEKFKQEIDSAEAKRAARDRDAALRGEVPSSRIAGEQSRSALGGVVEFGKGLLYGSPKSSIQDTVNKYSSGELRQILEQEELGGTK